MNAWRERKRAAEEKNNREKKEIIISEVKRKENGRSTYCLLDGDKVEKQ